MPTSLLDRAVAAASALLDNRTSRRGFLARVAVVGSALAVGPGRFLLRPGTAYATVCGIDASCSSGYTAFCVTVNDGVNRCPPGSLVGGWWKSDNAAFCCGNARYYIDCHSTCSCGCGGGNNFCGEGCRNCSCGCGPTGQCDERKVCCNNFRYGQCNQSVSCTGPVWCRVVTCTPPWKIPAWDCSATSATDQRTGQHSAPALLDCAAIGVHYTALGGQGGFLGEAQTGERTTPDAVGRYTVYDAGSIYWTPATGAHEVHGQILATWASLSWEAGPLGYPTNDELPTPDGKGRYNHFSGKNSPASIYWTPATGAHPVQGLIRAAWQQLGWEAGPVGYPTTNEQVTPDGKGRYNHFTGTGTAAAPTASVYWTASVGAVSVRGPIRAAWLARGGPDGRLGFPLREPRAVGTGRTRSDFQGGYVVYDAATGTTTVTLT